MVFFILILDNSIWKKKTFYTVLRISFFLKQNHAAIFCTLSFTCRDCDSETDLLRVINILITNLVLMPCFVLVLEYSRHVLTLTLTLHQGEEHTCDGTQNRCHKSKSTKKFDTNGGFN